MDTRTGASSASLEPPPPDLRPVAVTRWSARLAEAQCERDYRVHRFADDRRRALLLMGLMAGASVLNLFIEIYSYLRGTGGIAALVSVVATIVFPIAGFAIIQRLRKPQLLELFIVLVIPVGVTLRMVMVTLHPDVAEMGPAMMVGIVFVIYLYLPIRLVKAAALAIGFSLLAPLWWRYSLGSTLPPDQFFRTIVWLLVANALGFIAANSLQRSLRTQFAQSLLLQQLLSTDSLTGIANRRRFDSALEREWRRCRRTGAPLSLLMIDVDHFKPYNDQLGHQQGDEALRQVARLLVEGVGRPGDLVARYGGEEFVCMLAGNGMAAALAVANKLIETVRYADIYHPRSPAGARLTISIGVATAKDLSGKPATLMALADTLLYAAKAAGRNQVIVGSLDARKGGKPAARAA